MTSPFLSVVIPAYNESGNYKNGSLDQLVPFLSRQKFSWELVLVNDGSTDATGSLLAQFSHTHPHTRILTIPHGGKSAAVRAGVMAARGAIILFTDFDQSTPLKFCLPFLAAHQQGADVVIGVREGRRDVKSDSFFSKLRSRVFLFFVRIVALPGIKDSQCGFKSFTRASARKLFSSLQVCRPDRVVGGSMGAFDVEILFLARKFGYKISQLPVDWIRVPSTHLNIWREPLMMLRDTCSIRLYAILGRYG